MSRPSARALCVVLLVAAACWPAREARAQADAPTEYERWNRALRGIAPNPSRGAEVRGLVLQRDVAELALEAGRLHLLEPIDGRVVGAVFVGQGRFRMSAPIETEAAQLERAFEQDTISRRFTRAVLLFTDTTEAELAGALPLGATTPPLPEARGAIEDAIEFIEAGDEGIDREVMVPLLNGGPGLFQAYIAGGDGDPVIFELTPYNSEEVSLSRDARGPGSVREVVTRFYQREDYESGRSMPQEALDLVRVQSYDVESTIADNLDFSGAARLSLTIPTAIHEWIPFHLYHELEVDSARWGDGTPVTFFQPEETGDVWLKLSPAPAAPAEVVLHYHGELLERPQRDFWIVIASSSGWYPVHEYGRLASYRLTFHAPRRLTIASVGKLVARDTVGQRVTTRWETPAAALVTFNVGEFEETTYDNPAAPPLKLQINEEAHETLAGLVAQARGYLPQQQDMAEAVGTDLIASFDFYNGVYGPTPATEFIATEIPALHGEAYPGLVLLSWLTFQYTREQGYDEMFRAHEVAHQWWGIGVRPATYHDRWLSEGFAEFSGLWYMARARGSIDLLRKRLKETREELLQRRDLAPPISLGTRAGSSENPGDYQLTIYSKGAWVLHMLRTMLTDHDTGSDDRFTELMRGFYTKYLGRAATTQQFQAEAEAQLGVDLSWFFDQWVHGSGIPTYTFSHLLEDQPDGSVKATVRVRQQGVPSDFRMIVPLLLEFGEEFATVPIEVVGPVTQIELPLLPRRPSAVVFNPYESVLAETRTEGWR
jgi:hypothetical protein